MSYNWFYWFLITALIEKQSKTATIVVPLQSFVLKEIMMQCSNDSKREVKNLPVVRDFLFSDFRNIPERTDFAPQKSVNLLHLSETTCKRNTKNNRAFNFSTIERILRADKAPGKGKEVFGSYKRSLEWRRNTPSNLEGYLFLSTLSSFDEIQMELTQVERIEHRIL